MEEKEELSISLSKFAKDDEHARLLTSKRALTAFHEKCLDLVKDKQSGYLNTDDFTDLLGGQDNATPAFLKDLLNKMVANNFIQFYEHSEGRPVFKIIKKDKGVDLASLSPEENLIYQRLHQAGNNGVWSQALQRTTNIPQTAFNRAIKSLETKKYIKRVRSVKVSRSTCYIDRAKQKLKAILMLYDLEPADDLTGGPWYTERDGLDSVFVEDLLQVVVRFVDKRSFPNAKKVKKADGTETIINRFYQPSYRGYATAQDIYDAIISSEILQDDVKETFGISQVHQLLDVACIAKQIQKRTDGETYRSLLPDEEIVEPDELDVLYNYEGLVEDSNSVMLQKGYTEAPCGRCPVFVECGAPGEEVSAASCVYWDEWTGQIRPDDF